MEDTHLEPDCPFCNPATDRVFFRGDRVTGLWDAHPVAAGHALLIPDRHVASWFDATPDEQLELMRSLQIARAAIEMRHQPDGYNIGINIGGVAGQTIWHLHLHLIPRYVGDVVDPTGGVRHVIPARGNYLVAPAANQGPEESPLARGGSEDPLLDRLVSLLGSATAVDVTAAFTLESGVRVLEEHLRDVLDGGGHVRILTGDYLGVTEPRALRRLLDLQGGVEIRVFESGATSFHPKAYIITTAEGEGTAYVGSSNLSESALRNGIEWNFRVITSGDRCGFTEVVNAFTRLWEDDRSRPLDIGWINAYEASRTQPMPRTSGVAPDPVAPPPEPHEVQRAALDELAKTRQDGNTAGLVVLATGLGKTWLSAFDTQQGGYRRVLFIAHREEILSQALRTFRAIRPEASFGLYNGFEKAPEADVLFASIQTLGRKAHLRRFDPREFDYIVVDEFHHAAAQSYRRVINYFKPDFLLGLTATPERTDGADLLTLCSDNLVYRCDIAEGIRRGLLAPFAYYGVPDEVDYDNIPWRSTRFDEEKLTNAVATQSRARNALEQLRRYGLQRIIAFCVSQRHADFMAEFFRSEGLRAVAVHSGGTSAPRALSLQQLEAGDVDVVCAVDMFNEGVDLPHVDTILMLRPTESRILWLQQFGRGLRYQPSKTLRVIDYIGNHRIFLTKVRALLDLGNGNREVAFALDQLDNGTRELPPGCSVTYELEAKDILRKLIGPEPDGLQRYYVEFRETHGVRPLALEAFEDGFSPRSVRAGFGSWLGFVGGMGDLSRIQEETRGRIGAFLEQLEVTPMNKSYKMLLLQSMIAEDAFPGSISRDRLTSRFSELVRRYARLRQEVGGALDDPKALRRLIESNPIAAWAGGAGTGGVAYFSYDGETFSSTFSLPEEQREAAQDLTAEILDWRLMECLRRVGAERGADRFVCRVSHANGRPIVFLPSREHVPTMPDGWTELLIDGETYQGNFVKVALNVVCRPGTDQNLLPDILRRWFGPTAGRPGRSDAVEFERTASEYMMRPASAAALDSTGPIRWRRYNREAAAEAVGMKLSGWERQAGIVQRPDRLLFFVTLDKSTMPEEHKFQDRFLSPAEFEWQSQNRNTQASSIGQQIRHHDRNSTAVHLFVRKQAKVAGRTQDFIYAGALTYLRWEGEQPITVWWKLEEAVPERLWDELEIPGSSSA